MPSAEDYRAVLGLDAAADRADIVAAYRRLAMRWHPDRNDSPQATEKFQQIQKAYQKLLAMSASHSPRDLWNEAFYGDAFTKPKPKPKAKPEYSPPPKSAAGAGKTQKTANSTNTANDTPDIRDAGENFGENFRESIWDNFPYVSAGCLFAGLVALIELPSPGDWVLFSLAVAAANSLYYTGSTVAALRAESAFRLAVQLYFVGLLCFGVWHMAGAALGFK